MIHVPMFGMENNDSSLQARRRAFLTSYGYDVSTDLDEFTEVVGHIPTLERVYPSPLEYPLFENYGPRAKLTLFSTITPYTTAWVTVATGDLEREYVEYERGDLWRVVKIEAV